MSNFTSTLSLNKGSKSIISNEILEFHTPSLPVPLFSNPNEVFGTLAITIAKTMKTKKPLYIQCTVDVSDSMSEKGNNTYTRLDYVKRTLIKMFTFLVETVDTEVRVHIDTFSTNFTTVMQTVLLTKENLEDLSDKINEMKSNGLTNIELALNKSNAIMKSNLALHPASKSVHLFLTDGDVTAGASHTNTLLELVNPNFTNIFIGYGAQHNATLLSKCANKSQHNKYLFVDNFEQTGVVYGEIMHSLLYSSVENASVIGNQGTLMYNAIKNTWEQSLQIPALFSEKEHIYHIKSIDPDNATVTLHGIICNKIDDSVTVTGESEMLTLIQTLPHLINENNEILPVNLSKYVFRQKTMELLYSASHIQPYGHDIDNLKNEMKSFFKEMKIYMTDNELCGDTFMKILCEDIYISYSTLGTREGYMLSESRNVSQHNQDMYRSGSASRRVMKRSVPPVKQQYIDDDDDDDDDDNNKCVFQRTCTVGPYDYEEEYEDESTQKEDESIDPNDIDNYHYEYISENVYSTPAMMQVVRAVSD